MADETSSEMDVELGDDYFITLDYDDGTSEECEVIGIFEHDGGKYIALGPEESDDVYIYGYRETDDGGFDLLELDESVFDDVSAAYLAIQNQLEGELGG